MRVCVRACVCVYVCVRACVLESKPAYLSTPGNDFFHFFNTGTRMKLA